MLSCWRWPATASGEYHNQPATVKGELSKDLVPERPGKITAREKRLARIWGTAPWLALAGVTIAPPAALMLAYLLSGFSPLFLVLAITSVPFSLIAAMIVALFLLIYRRQWTRKLRDRLASDGITADEVGFFLNELTSGEKRSLRDMEKQQPLLADAYRETLALRLNATRLTASARRDWSDPGCWSRRRIDLRRRSKRSRFRSWHRIGNSRRCSL